MATLNSFSDVVGDDPTLVQDIPNNPQVEPLGGPITVDDLIDRFSEAIYDQSKDTHLYKFLTALCGDAGAGLLKKQTYASRLRNEGPNLTFGELDIFYTQNFRFERIRPELYPINPTDGQPFDPAVDDLTPEQWDDLEAADNSYKHRLQEFFNATRLGNSPDGIAMAAKSATSLEVETIENYKAVFDTLSDDVQGVVPQGITFSPNEFILTPRVVDESGNSSTTLAYQTPLGKQYNPQTNITTWVTSNQTYLYPDIERNMIRVIDRVRPVNSLVTVTNTNVHYKHINTLSVAASSDKIRVTRFVTGNDAVDWPDLDTTQAHFIQADVENEAPSQAQTSIDQPNIYQTVENVRSYTDLATIDPTYNTTGFYTGDHPAAVKYRSDHAGDYYRVITQIFTFLQNAPPLLFSSDFALATNNTLAILVGASDSNVSK